jgi:hypothetical protein
MIFKKISEIRHFDSGVEFFLPGTGGKPPGKTKGPSDSF